MGKIESDFIKNQMILAHDFAELMYGAHIAYNCLLQKIAFGNEIFEEEWEEWIRDLKSNMIAFDAFDLDRVLSYASTIFCSFYK